MDYGEKCRICEFVEIVNALSDLLNFELREEFDVILFFIFEEVFALLSKRNGVSSFLIVSTSFLIHEPNGFGKF